MMKVLACMLSFLFVQQLHAQQVFYIYIQSEDRKPFYARMNNKVISSTAGGYLLIPKLQNGGYRAAFGFPGKTGEEEFLFTIDNADQGYDLKGAPGGNGHILFNLLTYKMENPVAAGTEPKKETASGNNFGDLLAEAVKDPTVKNIEIVKPPEPVKQPPPVEQPKIKEQAPADTLKQVVAVEKKAEPPPVIKPDTMMIKNPPAEEKPIAPPPTIKVETPVVKDDPGKPVIDVPPVRLTGSVSVIYRRSGKEGTDLVLADRTNGGNDTIRVFVPHLSGDTLVAEAPPVEKTIVPPPVKTEAPEVKIEPVVPPAPVAITPPAETKKDDKFLNIELKNPNAGATPDTLSISKPDTGTAPKKLVMVNTDCKKIAEENDFIKLRTKMAGEQSNEEMISVAIKEFRKRCFTSAQVKNLSVLLTGDDGKYRFFEVAYPFVYDSNNYPALEEQLTDLYQKNRFRALVKKN